MRLYDAAIGSLARLAQHLNGLRSSTRLQEDLIRTAREGKKNFGFGTMDIGSPWNEDGNGNGSSPAQDGVKEHEEEMEMAASVRLLTRFRHMAGTQLDDLVVSPPLLFHVTLF